MLRPRVPGAAQEAGHLVGHDVGVEVDQHEDVGHDSDEEGLEAAGDGEGHRLHFEVLLLQAVAAVQVDGGKVHYLIWVVDVLAV